MVGLIPFVVVVSLLLAPSIVTGQTGTAFVYQGRLSEGVAPADGVFDFQVILYDAPIGGSQVGSIVNLDDVVVANGVFTARLDFGAEFNGSKRWLDIGVRPGASSGAHSILTPRQELTPAPYAQHATNATTVAGLTCANNQVAKWSGSGWICGTDDDTTPPGATAPLATNGSTFSLSACAPNQIYKMNGAGTAWACAFDVDTNTTYGAGGGLSLVGTQFSVNSTVARTDAASGNQAFDTNLLFLDYTNNRVGIGIAAPLGTFHLDGGDAAADASGSGIRLTAQSGGLDGPDGNDTGGNGGTIFLTPGAGAPGASAGDFFVVGTSGGAGTAAQAGGEGSDLTAGAGLGGDSTFTTFGGSGGDVTIAAGFGGDSAGGTGGGGGTMTIDGGNGGSPNGFGGNLTLRAGDATGSAPGGPVLIQAGDSVSGFAGEITLVPGDGNSGVDGSVQLGNGTAASNSTINGPIVVQVVDGDMNFATAGKGIILQSPDGLACRRITINNSGTLVALTVPCP